MKLENLIPTLASQIPIVAIDVLAPEELTIIRHIQVETLAMESTGVYWIPLFQILEMRGFEVKLVNAHHVKTLPGRKSDVQRLSMARLSYIAMACWLAHFVLQIKYVFSAAISGNEIT